MKDIEIMYTMPDKIRKHMYENKGAFRFYKLNGISLMDCKNEEILKFLQIFVSKLSPEIMNKFMGTEIYTEYKQEWSFIINNSYDYEEAETILQVKRLFERCGITITCMQAEFMWSAYSDSVCASWICHQDDDTAWRDILTNVICDSNLQKAMGL